MIPIWWIYSEIDLRFQLKWKGWVLNDSTMVSLAPETDAEQILQNMLFDVKQSKNGEQLESFPLLVLLMRRLI
jgi:hypothetical protein